jgi:hypothetical protein
MAAPDPNFTDKPDKNYKILAMSRPKRICEALHHGHIRKGVREL